FGRIMLRQQRGSIVNMTSVAARSGFARLSAYCASKGGLEALTRALGVEWATQGVRVNAIGPAFVETDMTADVRAHQGISASLLGRTPMRRYATPDEVVGAPLFPASDASSYATTGCWPRPWSRPRGARRRRGDASWPAPTARSWWSNERPRPRRGAAAGQPLLRVRTAEPDRAAAGVPGRRRAGGRRLRPA